MNVSTYKLEAIPVNEIAYITRLRCIYSWRVSLHWLLTAAFFWSKKYWKLQQAEKSTYEIMFTIN